MNVGPLNVLLAMGLVALDTNGGSSLTTDGRQRLRKAEDADMSRRMNVKDLRNDGPRTAALPREAPDDR